MSEASQGAAPVKLVDYYSPAMMWRRSRLQWDRKIRLAAQRFWRCAVRRHERMELREYLDFHLSVYKWLVCQQTGGAERASAAFIDEKDALAAALDDWDRDVQNGTLLSREQFSQSLFELADVYVDSVERKRYVQFLTELFDNVTIAASGAKRSWRWRWSEEVLTATMGEVAPLRAPLALRGARGRANQHEASTASKAGRDASPRLGSGKWKHIRARSAEHMANNEKRP